MPPTTLSDDATKPATDAATSPPPPSPGAAPTPAAPSPAATPSTATSTPTPHPAAAGLRALGLTDATDVIDTATNTPIDLAEKLARMGATVDAVISMAGEVDDLAVDVFGANRRAVIAASTSASADALRDVGDEALSAARRALWRARSLAAAINGRPSFSPGAAAADPQPGIAIVADGVASRLADALRPIAEAPFSDAWAQHLKDAHGMASPALDRVLSLILGRDVVAAPAPNHDTGRRAAMDRRRFVVPRSALALGRGVADLRAHVDVARTAALIAASSRFAASFEPSPSFLLGDDRARVMTYAELDRVAVFLHPLTDAPLTHIDGRLVSAAGVDWSRAFIASPLPAHVVDASSPRGSALLRDPMAAGTLPRAAWLLLARMPRVRAAFGDALVPPDLGTEKAVLRALLQADVDDELSDLQDLARAVVYYAELEPDVLRDAEAMLSLPRQGLAAFRPGRSTLG